jgi:hypothetical protein
MRLVLDLPPSWTRDAAGWRRGSALLTIDPPVPGNPVGEPIDAGDWPARARREADVLVVEVGLLLGLSVTLRLTGEGEGDLRAALATARVVDDDEPRCLDDLLSVP